MASIGIIFLSLEGDLLKNTKEEYNIKLYPIYKMFSWDLLFYYAISFIFFTQIKNIDAADVLLSEAFFPIFKFILLMPLTALINKVGKRNSLIIANMFNVFSILTYIVAQNFLYIIIGQFLSAVAFDIKGVAEANLLYDSLPRDEKRGNKFSKIDGKGTAWYYYADAITTLASGFLFVVNGYIPLVLCLIFCIMATALSFKFKEVNKASEEPVVSAKTYIKDLRHSIRYMLQSKRLKYLIIFGAFFSGLLSALISLRSGILQQMGIGRQYFGVIFAVLGIISGIAAKNQNRIHNRYKNKTLAYLSIPTTISCILIGFFIIVDLPFKITLYLVLLMFLIQFVAKGPFYTLIRRYLNNFTTSSVRNKITSAYNLIESIARAGILFLASFLLRITNASNTLLVVGCVLTIITVLLLDKMRTKVGLKPEQYSKKEIEFLEIK